jgi:hypothetical protein
MKSPVNVLQLAEYRGGRAGDVEFVLWLIHPRFFRGASASHWFIKRRSRTTIGEGVRPISRGRSLSKEWGSAQRTGNPKPQERRTHQCR